MTEKVEIARSFSRKVNLGNYETVDVFCSAKQEVEQVDADQTSKDLSFWVQEQVMNDIEEFKEKRDLLKVELIKAQIKNDTKTEEVSIPK